MKVRILNLGAGVQSTAIYLMMMEGEIHPADVAVFADTQDEPPHVYEHLRWMQSLGGPPIEIVTTGKLSESLENGTDAAGNALADESQHFIAIPAYVKNQDGSRGMVSRQCTADFKVRPIEAFIRERYGDGKGKPIPRDVEITQIFGLSYDEPKRVIRVQQRFSAKPRNWRCEFPLWDLQATRGECVKYLAGRVPHEVGRSACVYCPFKSDAEWRWLRDNCPDGWAKAVEIDEICRRGKMRRGERYLHGSLVPLAEADLRERDERTGQKSLPMFIDECEGMCGN